MTDQEINEAVARKLGWTRKSVITGDAILHGMDVPGSLWHSPIRRYHERDDSGMGVHEFSQLPDYCHSIAAAWEIVEWAKGKMTVDLYSQNEGNFVFRFWQLNATSAGEWLCESEADTAPMAICLAFLKLETP